MQCYKALSHSRTNMSHAKPTSENHEEVNDSPLGFARDLSGICDENFDDCKQSYPHVLLRRTHLDVWKSTHHS